MFWLISAEMHFKRTTHISFYHTTTFRDSQCLDFWDFNQNAKDANSSCERKGETCNDGEKFLFSHYLPPPVSTRILANKEREHGNYHKKKIFIECLYHSCIALRRLCATAFPFDTQEYQTWEFWSILSQMKYRNAEKPF